LCGCEEIKLNLELDIYAIPCYCKKPLVHR